jgi:hypothetical protein
MNILPTLTTGDALYASSQLGLITPWLALRPAEDRGVRGPEPPAPARTNGKACGTEPYGLGWERSHMRASSVSCGRRHKRLSGHRHLCQQRSTGAGWNGPGQREKEGRTRHRIVCSSVGPHRKTFPFRIQLLLRKLLGEVS